MKIKFVIILSYLAFALSVGAFGTVVFMHLYSEPVMLQTSVASSNVALRVRGGSLQFSQNPSPSLNAVDVSLDDQVTVGSLGDVEVSDLRGNARVGWTVNLDSLTNYSSDDGNYSIPLSNTTLSVSGLNVVNGDVNYVSAVPGSLIPIDADNDGVSDSAITLIQTVNEDGDGRPYRGINRVRFTPEIALTVPGGLPAQNYTSVYTLSVQ